MVILQVEVCCGQWPQDAGATGCEVPALGLGTTRQPALRRAAAVCANVFSHSKTGRQAGARSPRVLVPAFQDIPALSEISLTGGKKSWWSF